MLVQILVFAASLVIMSAVVLPGHLPARSTGHSADTHGAHSAAEPATKGGPGGAIYSVVLVVILSLLVAAGFTALSNM
ncbi:hypothetical protein [Nakamurella lactea]|uniref:hypothetical protein n=1 Tax=Nakamurella lactea TaxID=459515 RepID=UPI0004063652|nr:hypothetical protein [Nakamurella lactea]